MYFFRFFFGVRGFTCGYLLFLSFVFVRGALVLRMDSWVSFLFFLCYPQLFFSAALPFGIKMPFVYRYFDWNPDLQFAPVSLQKCHFTVF